MAAGSLVRRSSLGAALWVGILGLTVASLAVWQYWRTSLRTVDAGLTVDARALAERITVSNGLLEIEIDATMGLRGPVEGDERYYGVYDASGQLLDGTSPIVPDRLSPGPPFRTRMGYREVLVDGPRESVVVVGQSLGAIYGDVRRLAASLLIASLVGAGLALPVAVWLRRQLARSIGQIDETARSLAPGQPTRIDVERVAEEFVGVAGTLNDAFDRLEQALARERQLTSDASHELRTPVTTLVAETQWALGRPRSTADYHRSLEVCARQGVRMKDLVENLLTLARLEAGTLPPARDHVELRPIVDETVAELEPLARHHRVTVLVDGDAVVWADRVQMRILLSNLLSNAIRYNHAEGEVRVTVSAVDGRTLLSVSDTGLGLEPELAAHAFERFWRADPARSARDGGNGLGLAISKAIVVAHSGTIAVQSAPDQGTTFSVELPAGSSA
ncbi:MAG: ATP-binding protein [Vicinamibacterales bacterium]